MLMRTIDTDVVIVGAGPAGIFCALSLLERGFTGRIVMVDKVLAVEDRMPEAVRHARTANPAVSRRGSRRGSVLDGKLSLSADVGGDLPGPHWRDEAQDAIGKWTAWPGFGADVRVEGAERKPEVDDPPPRYQSVRLVDCPLRHLGTERARDLYAYRAPPARGGRRPAFRTECTQVLIEESGAEARRLPDGACRSALGVPWWPRGWRGADWSTHVPRACDSVRTHCGHRRARGSAKRGYGDGERRAVRASSSVIRPFKNKVRTVCQNPGGFVSQENYDGGLAVVNGHSYKERKSANTNLAILCSHNFSEPFDQPIAYAQKVGELTNMLGDGRILVQRLGDILDGKRTWD
ncbi:MAG: FAD-dependent protein, partial [Eggerthella lenta]